MRKTTEKSPKVQTTDEKLSFLGRWSIDSTKLWLPLSDVEILDDSIQYLYQNICVDTGEVEKEYKKNSLAIESDGIKTRYLIQELPYNLGDGRYEKRQYFVILFNSKLLRELYFDGIDAGNIRNVYESLIAQGVALFSYETFLDGILSDTDFKTDVLIGKDGYKSISHYFRFNSKEGKRLGVGFKEYRSKDNTGIQFGTRDHATPGRPYFKLYGKGIEMQLGKFFQLHFPGFHYPDLFRLEFTLKNKSFYRTYNLGSNKLRDVLKWSQSDLKQLSKTIIMKHLYGTIRSEVESDDSMKPLDRLFLMFLKDQINAGYSIGRVLMLIQNEFSDDSPKERNARKRYKDQFMELYSEHFQKDKAAQLTETVQNAMNDFGIGDEFMKVENKGL